MASLFDGNTAIHLSRSEMAIQYAEIQNFISCLRASIDVGSLFELELVFYMIFIKRVTQFTKHIS